MIIGDKKMSVYEIIRDCLELHKGKNNPVTSAEVSNIIGINEDDTHAQTRSLILATADMYRLPLAANNRGYYLITSDAEYDEYMENLDSRIDGITQRKKIITKNYKR